MSILFVFDKEDSREKFYPMWNNGLQGFAKFNLASNEKVVNAYNISLLVKGLGKQEALNLLDMGNITASKNKSKEKVHEMVVEKWDEIVTYFCGVMGTYDNSVSRGTDALPTPAEARASAIVFFKKGNNLTAYWADGLKGVAAVEMGYPLFLHPNIRTSERLNEIIHTISKKALEDMMSSINRRVVSRGSETWMTSDRLQQHVQENWHTIIERARGQSILPSMELNEPDEEDEPGNTQRLDKLAMKFALDIPIKSYMSAELLERTKAMFPMNIPIGCREHHIFTVGHAMDYIAKMSGLAKCEFRIMDKSTIPTDEASLVELYEKQLRVVLQTPRIVTVCINRPDDDSSGFSLCFDPERTTVGDVKHSICVEKDLEMNSFVLKYDSKVMDTWRRLREYMDNKDDALIKIKLAPAGLMGGGLQRGVAKHILKSKGDKQVLNEDATTFKTTFDACLQVFNSGTYNVAMAIEELQVAQLQELETFLEPNKKPNNVKCSEFYEHLTPYINMADTSEKIACALAQFRELVSADLKSSFGKTDATIVNALRRKVSNTLAVKKDRIAQSQSDTTSASVPVPAPMSY